ncbi:MAG TPA: ATP-binding protein [Phenylobacterium sp.]
MLQVKADDPVAAATAGVVDVNLTAYQLSIAGFRLPVWAHCAFNAIAAAGMLLLGHPWLAAAFFVSASAFDAVQQTLLRRWLETSVGVEEAAGMRRLALLNLVRVVVYTAPGFLMALNGGLAEFIWYGVQLATLLAAGMGAGALSARLFWAFFTPMLLEVIALAILILAPAQAAGVLLNLAVLFVITTGVAMSAARTISSWHKAFLNSVATTDALAVARDQAVAERAAADEAREAARRANSAKSNFLATMSHEIRTPMNGVLGMAQLLQRDETDPVQAERLAVLIDSGEYLLSILNDILDVSKIDAGKLEITPAPEPVRPFLERLVSFWGARADERGVSLDLEVAGDVPVVVLADGLRLRQVLFNLVGNALKFTETGSVKVLCAASGHDGDTVRLHLAVRDTGAGIAPQHLPHLFDRFSQGDETEARRFGGTGLGLAIVRQLVELMGGRVWVESTLGVGSTFHVELPVPVVEAVPATIAATDEEPAAAGLAPLTVLAVDDNTVNLLVLEQLLGSLGQTVVKAGGGEAALQALGEQVFDLVLADIQMPGMTGVELLHRVRATPGANQMTPMIALTADVTSGGRQRYLELGFDEHAAKPIQLEELLGAIARVTTPGAARSERAA